MKPETEPRVFDPGARFVHLAADGRAEPIEVTPTFWRGEGGRYARLLGAVDFRGPEDLHASMQEMHPEADELIYVASGAIDVMLEGPDGEQRLPLEAGQAAIVPVGVWHRLVARRPGRLLFVNSRAGMQSRPYAGGG